MQEYITLCYPNGNAKAFKIPQEIEKLWFYKYYSSEENIRDGLRYVFKINRNKPISDKNGKP